MWQVKKGLWNNLELALLRLSWDLHYMLWLVTISRNIFEECTNTHRWIWTDDIFSLERVSYKPTSIDH